MIEKQEEFLKELGCFFTTGFDKIEDIRYKNHVYVARIFKNQKTYIAKFFEKKEDAKEIQNYKILKKIGHRILDTYYLGRNLIIMQDINALTGYRIASEIDQISENFLKNLATWYRQLHSLGKNAPLDVVSYCEYNFITKENVSKLEGLISGNAFNFIMEKLGAIQYCARSLQYTLVYNDFYYDNVALSPRAVFLFDYNLLGKGCITSDLNNVLSILNPEAGQKFLDFYGRAYIPTGEDLKVFVIGNLSSLIMATKKEVLPFYAQEIIEKINSKEFEEALIKI